MRAGGIRVLPVAGLLAAIAAITVWLVVAVGVVQTPDRPLYVAGEGVAWVLFTAAVLLLLRVPPRAVPALVLAGTLLLGLAGLTGPPTTSTDSARYNWDGIVQDAGVSPYAFVPADARLAELRPSWLFPAGTTDADGGIACPPRVFETVEVGTGDGLCTAINRPQVPTIYPPVAEALFALARIAVPREVAYLPMQVLGLVSVLAITLLLLSTLRGLGRDPRWAAAFGWCPLVTAEAVTNAHIDGPATLLALVATVLVVRGRALAGGVVLGLAIATKLLPVLIAPPLIRRRPVAVLGGAVGAVLLVYLPHLITAGAAVIGYLPGYLEEEGYEGGGRSALLSAVLPEGLSTVAAAVLLVVVVVVVLLKADPADPWTAQTMIVGSALLLASPRYAWYALLLVPFAVLSGRWEWFALVVALAVPKLDEDPWAFRAVLLAALGVVVAAIVLRRSMRPPSVSPTCWENAWRTRR